MYRGGGEKWKKECRSYLCASSACLRKHETAPRIVPSLLLGRKKQQDLQLQFRDGNLKLFRPFVVLFTSHNGYQPPAQPSIAIAISQPIRFAVPPELLSPPQLQADQTQLLGDGWRTCDPIPKFSPG